MLYIRTNQKKLYSEEYKQLRDAINNETNVNDIGKIIITDLFVIFICSPTWAEIKEHLLLGQSSKDHHDITTQVFKQKLKSLINFIIKHRVQRNTLRDVLH